MVDVRNGVPPAIDQMAQTVIWFVGGTIADTSAVKASTELGAATSYDVTYSFTTDGFPLVSSQEKTTDERLTLLNTLEALGKVTTTFGDGVTYVDSSEATAAATVLKPVSPATSKSGYFVVRAGVPYAQLAAAAQKATIYPVTLGPQMRGPINGSGKFTWKQQVILTGPPVESIMAA
ncbi:hypothetical protein [Microbacterium jejuense]|uniref:phage tail tube protein n=1 Tax=Microbacterium jejuense TaxID=1263637 RepID=UPI0031ECC9B9